MESKPNEREWQVWLESHSARFLMFARQQTRCEADAEDVLQEAALRIWRRTANGELPVPPPHTVVFGEIRRRAIDLARSSDRRERREDHSQQRQDSPPESWFETTIENREHARMIQQALSRISSAHGEVVTLKIWGGLTFNEIAAALEISANTAASRYRYGIDALKRQLTPALL